MKKLILFVFTIVATFSLTAQNQTINGNLHLTVTDGGNLRIGKINDRTNLEGIPLGGLAVQYNIDFSGFRDMAVDQIGARISALRFNKYQDNKAYVQKTGLAFFTNPSGLNAGTTDLKERMRITPEGNVGIGISNPSSLFEVNGTIRSKEVKIEATGWSDFVFDENYALPTLSEVEAHIKQNKHLPDVPSEKQVLEEGVNVVEMQAKLLQKVEELTLYVIEQDKQIKELRKDKETLIDQVGKLEEAVKQLN